ncbi:unnamed protein product [Adineta steineri]|uniref:Uncharacterized protein n=1 Tax=Adineta steineri TaxID=433720 RepID=A0A815LV08_9BILA|nr:unnamed protein product [Adineta steineri]CAF1280961.1 unnamed protein product [Adineta steineri]CAF1412681.1 unnamed protein product [Adineta steineri]CAF1418951.1 unnamed protein product [Adineta steineri]CAF1452026.1 unnamed protein product [Adineta steineri]
MQDDFDQYEQDDKRRAVMGRLAFENFAVPEDVVFSDNELQVPVESTKQRRFCCMNPLSGRKRSVRDLTRKQLEKKQI